MFRTRLRVGDVVEIDNGRITVRVDGVDGKEVSLAVDAARSIPIRKLPPMQSIRPRELILPK